MKQERGKHLTHRGVRLIFLMVVINGSKSHRHVSLNIPKIGNQTNFPEYFTYNIRYGNTSSLVNEPRIELMKVVKPSATTNLPPTFRDPMQNKDNTNRPDNKEEMYAAQFPYALEINKKMVNEGYEFGSAIKVQPHFCKSKSKEGRLCN